MFCTIVQSLDEIAPAALSLLNEIHYSGGQKQIVNGVHYPISSLLLLVCILYRKRSAKGWFVRKERSKKDPVVNTFYNLFNVSECVQMNEDRWMA